MVELTARGTGMLNAREWQQHRRSVYRYLRRRLPSREVAEDLTQEALLRFHRSKPALTSPAQVAAWLLHSARNLAADYYRARRDEVSLDEQEVEAIGDASSSLRMLEPCIGVLAERLPEGYRAALLRDLEGVPQGEIAKRQRVSLSGAKSRIQRARGLMQREFERCCRYDFDHDGALVAYTPRERMECR